MTSASGWCVHKAWKEMLGGCPLFLWHITISGRKSRKETRQPRWLVTRKETARFSSQQLQNNGNCERLFLFGFKNELNLVELTVFSACSHSSLTKSRKFPCQKIVIFSCFKVIKMPLCSFIFMFISKWTSYEHKNIQMYKNDKYLLLCFHWCCFAAV